MDLKKTGKRLLFPPLWTMLLLAVISTAALIFVFAKGWEKAWFACIVYVPAFYTLTVICIACRNAFPRFYRTVRAKVYENKYAVRYLTDVKYKTHVRLFSSLIINLIYAAVNAVSAVVYSTAWFALFALYYTIMAVMRFLLVRYVSRNGLGISRLKELKRSRLCACILMTVNLSLSGAVLMMIYHQRGFEYRGILIYVMAMYTFYITTAAVIDLVKYRSCNSPVMSVSAIIKLASALVSMLSLETAMFSQFGTDMAPENQRLMIILTGAGISVIVAAAAIITIMRSTKEIKAITHKENQQTLYDTANN